MAISITFRGTGTAGSTTAAVVSSTVSLAEDVLLSSFLAAGGVGEAVVADGGRWLSAMNILKTARQAVKRKSAMLRKL